MELIFFIIAIALLFYLTGFAVARWFYRKHYKQLIEDGEKLYAESAKVRDEVSFLRKEQTRLNQEIQKRFNSP